jgi:hypothetical protein
LPDVLRENLKDCSSRATVYNEGARQDIFDEGELTPEATVKEYLKVETEDSREVE